MIKKEKIVIGNLTVSFYRFLGIPVFEKRKNTRLGWSEFRLFGMLVNRRKKPEKIPFNNSETVQPAPADWTPLVSILVDGNAGENALLTTLKSLTKQTYRTFEIVIQENLPEEAKELLVKSEIRIVFHESRNLEAGIKKSSGEYIAFCESGDAWAENHLSAKISKLRQFPDAGALVCSASLSGDWNYYELAVNEKFAGFSSGKNQFTDDEWEGENFVPSLSCCLIRKDALKACDFGPPHELLFDWWILRQIGSKNYFLFIPEKLSILSLSERTCSRFSLPPLLTELFQIKYKSLTKKETKPSLSFSPDCAVLKYAVRPVVPKKKRAAVFAAFNKDGRIDAGTAYYLKELQKITDGIVFVSDNPVLPEEIKKIEPYVTYVCCERHEEYDFGSYKRGIEYLDESRIIQEMNELILCNDSCTGPVYPFERLFQEMDSRSPASDFWGISRNFAVSEHIQSFFMVFKKQVFTSPLFAEFFSKVDKKEDIREVVLKYEIGLTDCLARQGFSYDSFIPFPLAAETSRRDDYLALEIPLIKKKALNGTYSIPRKKLKNLLEGVKSSNPDLYAVLEK